MSKGFKITDISLAEVGVGDDTVQVVTVEVTDMQTGDVATHEMRADRIDSHVAYAEPDVFRWDTPAFHQPMKIVGTITVTCRSIKTEMKKKGAL